MIGAVVLAAGRSQRMGEPKMVLPWGKTTVIGQVVGVLSQAKLDDIVVVTGGRREAVATALAPFQVKTIFNPDFHNGEMTRTLQVGLGALSPNLEAALVVLGDQPQIELQVVRAVVAAFRPGDDALIVPSYNMRRGHPWLVAQKFWAEIFDLRAPLIMRDFLNRHLSETLFLNMETASILQDLDTPDDYARFRPAVGDSQ